MSNFAVKDVGTDSSGRTILMTAYMRDWWEDCVAEMGFRPIIVQGAFMARVGGGASESAGYHDQGGCIDLRVWDLTDAQVQTMNRVVRTRGAGGWVRDETHGGMDPHYHLVLGTDRPLASGAATQWQQYLAGRDGLASNGADYMWRPNPIVTKPPEDDMTPDQDARLKRIEQRIDQIGDRSAARDVALRTLLKRHLNATDKQLDDIFAAVKDD